MGAASVKVVYENTSSILALSSWPGCHQLASHLLPDVVAVDHRQPCFLGTEARSPPAGTRGSGLTSPVAPLLIRSCEPPTSRVCRCAS